MVIGLNNRVLATDFIKKLSLMVINERNYVIYFRIHTFSNATVRANTKGKM